MTRLAPAVTVGIPTYNRAALLERALQSALAQDFRDLEIIVSDNASNDGTEALCRRIAEQHPRVRYVRQAQNIGGAHNFEAVLQLASGRCFMWLGDDDHMDSDYVRKALAVLDSDPGVALVSGSVRYYRGDLLIDEGRRFDVSSSRWWSRVVEYYWKVSDNGAFYGLMRTAAIRRVGLPNAIGGDWLSIAGIAACGRIVMLDNTVVHREMGGASLTHAHTARALGLPRLHALFPYLTIAFSAWRDIHTGGQTYADRPASERHLAAMLAFGTLVLRAFTTTLAQRLVGLRNLILRSARA